MDLKFSFRSEGGIERKCDFARFFFLEKEKKEKHDTYIHT